MRNDEIRAKRFGDNLEVEVTVCDGLDVVYVHISDAEGMIYSVTNKSIVECLVDEKEADDMEFLETYDFFEATHNSKYCDVFRLAQYVYNTL